MFVLLSTGRKGLTTFISHFVSPASVLALLGFALISSVSQAQPTVEQALQYVPVQKDVPYDTPAAKDFAKCSVKPEDRNGGSALVMRGPNGQILRSFDDTNKDNRVDRWSYFQNGIETYRDFDSNFNGKADQHRWLGFAGTKWGVDANEDGNIDSWNEISAEEVSAEIVSAVRDGDVERFATVLLKPTELEQLGLSPEITKVMAERLGTATRRFQAATRGQNLVNKNSQWVHYSASRPAVLPAGTSGAKKDIYIYENVAAMLDKGQLPVGTLVRANGQWRAVDIPTGLMPKEERNQFGSFLLTPPAAAPAGPVEEGMNEETQKLVKELAANDAAIRAEGNDAKRDTLYDRQVIVLRGLANANKDEQEIWIKQLAETLGTSVQSGEYSKGIEQLTKLNEEVSGQAEGTPLAGHVAYRLINAQYAVQLKNQKGDFANIQAWWTKQLESFVKSYPKGPDFTEAMLQLANAEELAGNDKVAIQSYEAILKNGEGDLQKAKAAGSKKRLESVGKPLAYGGTSLSDRKKQVSTAQYKGKYVLLHFWATWCDPCVAEMKKLERMKAFYAPDFEVIGVNVDTDEKAMLEFLRKNPPKWQQIYERGGFDSKPATDLGILTVPTRMLINPKGEVVKRSTDLQEVQDYLDNRLNSN